MRVAPAISALRALQNSLSGVQLIKQRLRLFQIERVEAFGKPSVDRSKKLAGLIPLALIAPEPRHAHRRAQFPEFCLLLVRVFRLSALSPHTDV